MDNLKYLKQISKFVQKSPKELSNLRSGDAFFDHMLKKFDEHIWKWGKILLITLN